MCVCAFEEEGRKKRERYFLVTVRAQPTDAERNTLTLNKMSNWCHLQCVSHRCESIGMESIHGCFVEWRSYMQTFHWLLISVPVLHWNLRPIRFCVRFQYSILQHVLLSFLITSGFCVATFSRPSECFILGAIDHVLKQPCLLCTV